VDDLLAAAQSAEELRILIGTVGWESGALSNAPQSRRRRSHTSASRHGSNW